MSIENLQFLTLVILNLVTIGLGIFAVRQRDRQYRLAKKHMKHMAKKQGKKKS